MTDLRIIAEYVIWYRIPIFDSVYLIRYIDLLNQINDNYEYYYYCLTALRVVYDNTSDSELKEIIINYSSESPFLKFIIDPVPFPSEEVLPKWLYYCRPNDLRELFDSKIYRQKARHFINEGSDDAKKFEEFFLKSL